MRTISNSDDIIDSRDIIARIEELETDKQALKDSVEEAEEHARAERAQQLADWQETEGEELKALQALAADASGYAPDWEHGATLIRDSYTEDYAQELADDIGAINSEAGWPNNCIDWERATREMLMDYTQVEFDGVTYWIR